MPTTYSLLPRALTLALPLPLGALDPRHELIEALFRAILLIPQHHILGPSVLDTFHYFLVARGAGASGTALLHRAAGEGAVEEAVELFDGGLEGGEGGVDLQKGGLV